MARNEDLFEAVYTGDKAAAVTAAEKAVEAGEPVDSLMDESLIPAMKQIGSDFESGEAFVPEMLIAARAMDAVLEVIKPLMTASGAQPKGRICIGTVKGDLHDIGKNLVTMMLRGAGYEVVDLGVDCPEDKYVDAVEQGAEVVCLSALLTTTMPAMKDVVEHLRSSGIQVPIVIGGAPVTQQYADEIGAQGYAETANGAVGAVERCLQSSS